MNKFKLALLLILPILIITSVTSNSHIFFPTDVIKNIPSFSEENWVRPKNSLLADPVYQFEPWRKYTKDSLRQGKFPLWNNLNSHGVPFFANFQSAVLYPLNIIYYVLPFNIALFLIPILKILILFIGAFLYLHEISIKKEVSLIGALAISTAGFPVAWLHWPHTSVFIILPLLLYLTEKILKAKKNKNTFFLCISILYMIGIFGGHPETLAHILLVHIAYVVFRFWVDIKIILKFIASISLGFLLGAVQIIPFLEYLLNSSVLNNRSIGPTDYFLPLKGLLLNFFPLMYGAPHKEIYKPINELTNFQETIGGYVGVMILLSSIFFLIKNKNSIVKFWGFLAGITVLLSYKLWPFYLIGQLPLLRLSANQRLIAFAGFGLAVVFAFFLQNALSTKKRNKILTLIPNKVFFLSALVLITLFGMSHFYPSDNWRLISYLQTIRVPIFIVTLSSIIFLYSLKLNKKFLLIITTALTVLLQVIILFHDYNPTTRLSEYYPSTELTDKLKTLPAGAYLEIGNPALPANINMMYSLKNIQNYDAIEINSFKKAFDRGFPIKNSWGNPEEVNPDVLESLNISYLVSDYDLNLKRYTIQKIDSEPVGELAKGKTLSVSFQGNNSILKQIRIKPATYNRINTCNLKINIKNFSNKVIYHSTLPCQKFRNNMFLTINTPNIVLAIKEKYTINFSSNSRENNTISLYGDKEKKPYLEIFYEDKERKNLYQLIGKTNSYYVFSVPKNKKTSHTNLTILFEDSSTSIYEVKSLNDKSIAIPRTFYPGWVGKVNGERVKLSKDGEFISIPVKKGSSLVEVKYMPLSFFIGLIISFISFTAILLFFLRTNLPLIIKNLTKVQKNLKILTFKQAFFGIAIGILTSISLSSIILPKVKFLITNPFTTAINWITVNHYPKGQDYFYYYGFFVIVLIGGLSGLILQILWKKRK